MVIGELYGVRASMKQIAQKKRQGADPYKDFSSGIRCYWADLGHHTRFCNDSPLRGQKKCGRRALWHLRMPNGGSCGNYCYRHCRELIKNRSARAMASWIRWLPPFKGDVWKQFMYKCNEAELAIAPRDYDSDPYPE